MQSQIFVLGASGTVGREVVELLVSRGISFKAGIHKNRLHLTEGEFTEASVEPIPIDCASEDSLADALHGTNVLFFLSPSVGNFVELAENVIKAAKRVKVRHIVRLSIANAEDGKYSLAKDHHRVDQMIERSEIPFTLIKPVAFMQNFLSHAPTIQGESKFYEPLGAAHVSSIDARDIAALAVTAMTQNGHEGKTYVITGPESLSDADVADVFSRVLERRVQYVDISEREAQVHWRKSGISEREVQWWTEYYQFNRDGGSSFLSPIDPILIGREPITFEMFVKDHAAEFGAPIVQDIKVDKAA